MIFIQFNLDYYHCVMNYATEETPTSKTNQSPKSSQEQWITIAISILILLSQIFQWARKIKKSKCWGVEIDMASDSSSSSGEEARVDIPQQTPREGAIHSSSA